MNHTTLIVKILTKPTQRVVGKERSVTEFIGKFYQYRNNKYTICKVSIWGRLAHDLDKFYGVKDYAIVEGYISIRESFFKDLNLKTAIEISAFKSYPLVVKPTQIKK